MAVADWLAALDRRAELRAKAGLTRRLHPRAAADGVIDLAGNDYLGLARHPEVVAAAAQALSAYGLGATGSRLVRGSTDAHHTLEETLADWLGTDRSLVFSSGYLANLGAIRALVRPRTLLISDAHNHASLIDGCRISGAETVVTPHADVAAVAAALAAAPGRWWSPSRSSPSTVTSPRWLRLHATAREHGALLLVDDAHALGVARPGRCARLTGAGLTGEPDVVVTATLSKALGGPVRGGRPGRVRPAPGGDRAGLDVSADGVGRRLPGPGGGGRLFPPALHPRQPVEAAADDQRRGATAGLRTRPGGHRGMCAMTDQWRGPVLITGTDTEVGKTVVTAAITAAAQAAGLRVAVVKPGQTGTATGDPADVETVTRLAAPMTGRTLASFPDPLAPLAAARVAELPPLELYNAVDAVRDEADKHDLVLVEGAGGLLVPMGLRPSGEPWTVADLAVSLGAAAVVVARAGLGTLNHTALTLEALERRAVPAGVVIGAWRPSRNWCTGRTSATCCRICSAPCRPAPERWTRECSGVRRRAGSPRRCTASSTTGAPGPTRPPEPPADLLTFVSADLGRGWVA